MLQALKNRQRRLDSGSLVPDAVSYTLVYDQSGLMKEFSEKRIAKPGYINGGLYFTPQAHKYFPNQATFSIEYDVSYA